MYRPKSKLLLMLYLFVLSRLKKACLANQVHNPRVLLRFSHCKIFQHSLLTTLIIISNSLLLATNLDRPHPKLQSDSISIDYRRFAANRLAYWFGNNAELISFWATGEAGLEWPKNSGLYPVFQAGLTLGGKGTDGQLYLSVSYFNSSYQPGKILANGMPDEPYKYHTYSLYKGDSTSSDYLNWPVHDGAPRDQNGKPLLLGNKTHWYVCNDAFAASNHYFTGLKPLGVEVQVMQFGWDQIEALRDVAIIKALFIHKGTVPLDSAYLALWCDPDLGFSYDDLVGCDTTHQLGYCYNADYDDYSYGTKIPAVGFQLLQGPLVPCPGSTGRRNGKVYPNTKNLPMTVFAHHSKGLYRFDDPVDDPENARWFYNYLKGLDQYGQPKIDPITNQPTLFSMPNDPLTGTGWVGTEGRDFRFIISCGPLHFAPGDTQEVIFACVIGESDNRLNGIATLRSYAPYLQDLYQNNFNIEQLPLRYLHEPQDYFQPDSDRLYIRVEAAPGVNLDLSQSALYFSSQKEGPFSSAPLIPTGQDSFYAVPTIADTQKTLYYYFGLTTNTGQVYRSPMSAPLYCHQTTIGYDHDAPQFISSSFTQKNPLVTLRYRQGIKLGGKYTFYDASPLDTIFFQYSLNGGSWQNLPLDSHSINVTYKYSRKLYNYELTWYKNLLIPDLNYGDQILYRIVVSDSSRVPNLGYAHSGTILIKKYETVLVPYYRMDDWVADGWQLCSSPAPYETGIRADKNSDYRDNIQTYLTCHNPFTGSIYTNLYLAIHGTQNLNYGDSLFVEVSPDLKNWYQETTGTGLQLIPTQLSEWWWRFPLKTSITKDNFFLRFRFKSDSLAENLEPGWSLDRVMLFADTVVTTAGWFGIDSLAQVDTTIFPVSDRCLLHWRLQRTDTCSIHLRLEYKSTYTDWSPLAPELIDQESWDWDVFQYSNTKEAQVRVHATNGLDAFTATFPHTFVIQNQRKQLIRVEHPSGHAEAQIQVAVINPAQLTGDDYELRFWGTNANFFSLFNLSQQTCLLDSLPLLPAEYESPVVDGIAIAVKNENFRLATESSGWRGSDCNWTVNVLREQGRYHFADYELRFTAQGSVDTNGTSLPFEVWNVTENYQPTIYAKINNPTRYLFGIYERWLGRKEIVYVVDLKAPSSGTNIAPQTGAIYYVKIPLTSEDIYHFKGQFVGIQASAAIPQHFALHPVYPNPFNPSTTVTYELPRTSMVMINVYNILGERIATLQNAYQLPGKYALTFDGSRLPSGIYFIEMRAEKWRQVRKCLLLK